MTNVNTRRFTADLLNDPYFIGFDNLIDKMSKSAQGQPNYPPYNIVKKDENTYELQLAIAGFSFDDLSVEVKDGVLSVTGNKAEEDTIYEYIHKGISARAFIRTFTLSDTVVVNGADLKDGILIVALENVIPEEKKPRKIDIGRSKETLLKG
tara:strand:+ start:2782 stop:3237 length:456 start_codon:yes stop_codon:yes gene_type:complete